jgi:penicillin-binding protein 1A
MVKKFFLTLVAFLVLAALSGAGVLFWLIAVEPGEEISIDNIRRILGRESPVLYGDGVTPLGVFFADAHRRYIEYREIPGDFVDALVAAEDSRFFSHFGFDIVGISRAAIKNIQAGRIVQGGSTLTQQTAKNLFKREERSFQAKFKELLYALRLEYHYSKEQIIEFYANQFYVSGNGLGLGVAARYYFDKEPGDLTLVEAAFIAGSVKRPNAYNPFIKKTKEDAALAEERALARMRYVVGKMRELGMISDAEFSQASTGPIPFNNGTVGFPLDYVMGMVTDAVASERVVEALAAHGIDNIATSGVRIVTTVDRDFQRSSLSALRKHLSYLDVRLRGYERDEVQNELASLDYTGDSVVERGSFLFGVVRSITKEDNEITVSVDFGRKRGAGIIDRHGLVELTDARVKWQQHRWSEAGDADIIGLLNQLKPQDKVWVQVREIEEDGQVLLDLARFPEVQGAAVVLQQGRILAVAGGAENRFFNRAVYGRRTMGSSFKPFVYTAALQLGWNTADLLTNRREVFVYQNQPYFPRPDHAIEHEEVSMSWAGVKSENLASVWLTAHLCDRLSSSEFFAVAEQLGLTPRVVDGEPEPYRLFQSRIRDRYGIVLNRDVIRQAAYRKTLQTIEPDLIFEGLEGETETIRSLHYGLGFDSFLAQINRDLDEGVYEEAREEELQLRRRLLSRTFLRLAGLRRQLASYFEDQRVSETFFDDQGRQLSGAQPQLFYNQPSNSYIFARSVPVGGQAVPVSRMRAQDYLNGLDIAERQAFIGRIKLGNLLSAAAFDFVDRQVETEFQRMVEQLPYRMEILEHVEDYRILVGLRYLMSLGEAMGIRSGLEPVLSFPLGSNSVTVLETTRVFETMVSGQSHFFTEANGDIDESLAIIDRIESEDGMVLYRPQQSSRFLVDPKTSLALGHILENTVKFGTGRAADQQIKLTGTGDEVVDQMGLSIPLLGKTGTANRYTNASFYGYLPAARDDGNGLTLENGFSVGVYVGYDDNKPMRRGSTRVTGSLGALPAWTGIVADIVARQSYAASLDPVDLSFNGLTINRPELGQKNLAINDGDGGVLGVPLRQVDPHDRYQPAIMTFGSATGDRAFEAERNVVPFWSNGPPAQPDRDTAAQPAHLSSDADLAESR